MRTRNFTLSNIVLFVKSSRVKVKQGFKANKVKQGFEEKQSRDLKQIETAWEGVKREAMNTLEWRRNVHSYSVLRQLRAVVSYKW